MDSKINKSKKKMNSLVLCVSSIYCPLPFVTRLTCSKSHFTSAFWSRDRSCMDEQIVQKKNVLILNENKEMFQ